ncbi:hypothetical protein Hdeb2414_s0001g00016191 [Helianthus debilis subsp. tardiflorus]
MIIFVLGFLLHCGFRLNVTLLQAIVLVSPLKALLLYLKPARLSRCPRPQKDTRVVL